MNKDTIIHSVFETYNGRRECVGVYDNNVDAQACVDRRTKCFDATYDIQLWRLGNRG